MIRAEHRWRQRVAKLGPSRRNTNSSGFSSLKSNVVIRREVYRRKDIRRTSLTIRKKQDRQSMPHTNLCVSAWLLVPDGVYNTNATKVCLHGLVVSGGCSGSTNRAFSRVLLVRYPTFFPTTVLSLLHCLPIKSRRKREVKQRVHPGVTKLLLWG